MFLVGLGGCLLFQGVVVLFFCIYRGLTEYNFYYYNWTFADP